MSVVPGTVHGMTTDRFFQPASRPHGEPSPADRFQAQHTNEPQPGAEQVQPDAENAQRTQHGVSQSARAEQGSGWGSPDASQPSAPSQYAAQSAQPAAQAPDFGQQPGAQASGQQSQPVYPQQGQQSQPGTLAKRLGMNAVGLAAVATLFAWACRLALAIADVYERLPYTVINIGEGIGLAVALGLAITGLVNLQKGKTAQAALWVGLGLGAAGLQLLMMILSLITSLTY